MLTTNSLTAGSCYDPVMHLSLPKYFQFAQFVTIIITLINNFRDLVDTHWFKFGCVSLKPDLSNPKESSV